MTGDVAPHARPLVVEFIGCTGSGKTRVAMAVGQALEERAVGVVTSRRLFWGTGPIDRMPHGTVQNPLLEIAGLMRPWRVLGRYREFLKCCRKAALANADSSYYAVRAMRGVWRNLWLFDWVRRRRDVSHVVLFDEGVVQCAHYLFAQLTKSPDISAVRRFAAVVPVPDLLVHVRADTPRLTSRMMERADPPRRGLTRGEAAELISHAQLVFESLADSLPPSVELIAIDNGEGADVAALARTVADRIHELVSRR